MPFMPIFFIVAFLMHPLFGWLIVIGGVVIVGFSLLTEQRTRRPTMAATISGAARQAIADASFRNAEVLKAMGMMPVFAQTFAVANAHHAGHNLDASDAASGIGSMAKVFRAVLQSAVLGLGAFLAILGEVSPGAMIAASILTARALAPIEVAVANWRGFVASRQGFERLRRLLVGAERADMPAGAARPRAHALGRGPLRRRARSDQADCSGRFLRSQSRTRPCNHRAERIRQIHAGALADGRLARRPRTRVPRRRTD